MKSQHDVNLNSAECIIKTENVLSFITTNICTGQSITVAKGVLDAFASMVVVGILTVLAAAMVVCFVVLLYKGVEAFRE